MAKTKINQKKWYTLRDLVAMRIFPWATSFASVRAIVLRDRRNWNVLDCQMFGEGRGTKYHFQGRNIIEFLKAIESGKIRL